MIIITLLEALVGWVILMLIGTNLVGFFSLGLMRKNFSISFLGNEALAINLAPKMIFAVEDTPPGVKGNSATNVFKEAKLDNGVTVKVPLFIKTGDKVKIDTRTGSYSEKAN